MASVQVAPHGSSMGVPQFNAPTQAEAQQALQQYRHMKDTGVPETDPEFIRVYKILSDVKQHRNYMSQRQAMAHQQMQQQKQMQQQQQQMPPNGANGPPSVPTASSAAAHRQSMPPSSNGSLAGTPRTAPVSKTAAPRTAPVSSGYFLPEQLSTLKTQIYAFKLLSKNLGIPQITQQQLFASKKMHIGAEQSRPATGLSKDGSEKAASSAPEPHAHHEYSRALDPLAVLQNQIDYHAHRIRSNRPRIPALEPVGVDFEKLRIERQQVVYNRMQARYAELKSIPVNLAHFDARDLDLSPDDTLKRKALIEMKMLGLYAKQKALREKIGRQMLQYDNLAMTANRSQYRRVKKQSVREARITEKLEKQQRDARETREKKKHHDYLTTILTHQREVQKAALDQRQKLMRFGRMMQEQHKLIEKEEQKRIERTAKQRLQALKSNDEEAYLKLLDQAKDTRITHLLKQTDGFLSQLAASVKAQQRKTAEKYGDESSNFNDEESEEEENDEDGEQNSRKIDYYAVAHRIKEEVTQQASILVGGTLKEYQLKGLQWMISLYNNNLNGILADEMGLGKTIQTISLITYLIEKKRQNGPYLVIVPLSTLTNWTLEFEKWAPSVAKIVYKGPPNARKQQQMHIRQGAFQVLLTTYEYIIKDKPILSRIKWIHMIIDEGHRMKNSQSKLSATLTQFYTTRYRLILTGTPLQNNLPELWALLNFVLPTIFKSVKSFDEWFNTPFANTGGQDKMELTEEEQILVIRRLHKVLRPFLLRRLKKDVEKDLPDKTEKVIKCKFSSLQTRLYKQFVTHNKLVVAGGGQSSKMGSRGLSNMIMQLRKLCNHPFVFDEVENQMNPTSTSNDLLWRTSGKFELLDRILPKYQATGHRVLMFFQMTAIMDIMEDYLRYRDVQFLRLDGTTKSDDRSDLLKAFNAPDSPYFIFLLSTRAGGLGLNLQTADTVIIYDSDWNPHQDLQAQDRAHRIGQKNEVRILRLISSNSVEEKILERAKFKLDMDGKVIQAGRFDNKSSETDRDAMLRVMLETADAAESLEQEEMDDEELNEILARSEAELPVFRQLDEERARDPTYGVQPGSKQMPRLMAENELPEIYLSDGNPVSDEPEMPIGRGARERTQVKYDDGLTEEQWLMAVDDDDDSPEQAIARKAARKARKEKKRMGLPASGESSPAASRDPSEDVEVTPKKGGRARKAGKSDKRKAEDLADEPPAKRKRGPTGPRAKAASAVEGMGPKQRKTLQQSLRRLHDTIMELESESDIEPDEDDDEPPGKRLIVGPFVALPRKTDFPDYFIVIKEPISMNMIDKKIKKEQYNSLADMERDVKTLVNNAKTYNEDTSTIFIDAVAIENAFDARLREEYAKHPELAGSDGQSQDGGSTAANTTTSTPAPASVVGATTVPTKLKLTFNKSSLASANGGSSGVVSEDEE